MDRKLRPVFLILALLAVGCCFAAFAQQKTVKTVPPVGANGIDGKSLYQEFCAVCHGRDGKGNGPAADSLKTHPTDLTQISHRNNGRFPDTRILAILNGDVAAGPHGSRDMPIWGKTFNDVSSSLSVAQGRKHSLVSYLEQMQTK